MFFKIKKSKKMLCPLVMFLLASMLVSFSYIEQSGAGGGFSQQSGELLNALVDDLIKQNVCQNDFMCSEMLETRTEGNNPIYINMYDQSDTKLASYVTAFFIEKGIKTTKGTPITLTVYPKPKSEYMGLIYGFYNKDQVLALEIN